MASAAAAHSLDAEGEGGTFPRSEPSKESIEAATTAAAAVGLLQQKQRSFANGNRPSSAAPGVYLGDAATVVAVCEGNSGSGRGSGVEEGARSVSDIIAEAMRDTTSIVRNKRDVVENGAEGGVWTGPDEKSVVLTAKPRSAPVLPEVPAGAQAAPASTCTPVQQSFVSPEKTNVKSGGGLEPGGAGGVRGAETGSAAPGGGGVGEDGLEGAVLSETTLRTEHSVKRAMAEAILDEGYMSSSSTVSSTAACALRSSIVGPPHCCPGNQGNGGSKVALQGEGMACLAVDASKCITAAATRGSSSSVNSCAMTSLSPPLTQTTPKRWSQSGIVERAGVAEPAAIGITTTVMDRASSVDDAPPTLPALQERRAAAAEAAAASEAALAGAFSPRSDYAAAAAGTRGYAGRGGVDAPFGHAVIIEEHVQAVAAVTTPAAATSATAAAVAIFADAPTSPLDPASTAELAEGAVLSLSGPCPAGIPVICGDTAAVANGRACGVEGSVEGAAVVEATAAATADADSISGCCSASNRGHPKAGPNGELGGGWAGRIADDAEGAASGGAIGATDGVEVGGGGGDGRLVLKGGRTSAVSKLASLAASAVMAGAAGRGWGKPPSSMTPSSPAPEEYIFLQEKEEGEGEEAGKEGEGGGRGIAGDGAGVGSGKAMLWSPSTRGVVSCGGGGLVPSVGDNCASERDATAAVDPANAVVGGGAGRGRSGPADKKEEPDSALSGTTTGGARCAGDESCYSWPVVVQGMGLSRALGGWGHVESNGLSKGGKKAGVEEDEDEEERLVVGASSGFENVHGDSSARESCSPWGNGREKGDVYREGSSSPEEEGGVPGGPVLFAVEDGEEPLDGLPGERSLYSGIGNGVGQAGAATAAVTSAAGEEAVAVSGVGGEENEEGEEGGGGAVVAGDGCDRVDCAPADATAGRGVAGHADLLGVEVDDSTFDQSWNDLVEGVADEGVLHAHGRAGLPDPLPDDAPVEGPLDVDPDADLDVQSGCANGEGGGGEGESGQNGGGGGGGGGGGSGVDFSGDDGYGTNSQDRQGGLLCPRAVVVVHARVFHFAGWRCRARARLLFSSCGGL